MNAQTTTQTPQPTVQPVIQKIIASRTHWVMRSTRPRLVSATWLPVVAAPTRR